MSYGIESRCLDSTDGRNVKAVQSSTSCSFVWLIIHANVLLTNTVSYETLQCDGCPLSSSQTWYNDDISCESSTCFSKWRLFFAHVVQCNLWQFPDNDLWLKQGKQSHNIRTSVKCISILSHLSIGHFWETKEIQI